MCAFLPEAGSSELLADLLQTFRDRLAAEHALARRRAVAGGAGPRLLAWARECLPHYFTKPASAMHRWLAGRLDLLRRQRSVKLNVLAPRGSAKSTVAALAFPLLAALEGWEPYIWIVSDTRRQAYAHLENIKLELLENPRLAERYPQAAGRGPLWRADYVVLRNGASLEAFGTGQRIRGRRRKAHRPTLIICDDLENEQQVLSAQQREQSRQWFHGTLMKAGTPQTNVVHLATALHRDALALRLHQTPGWVSRIFRAVQRWPDNMPLWAQWEAIYTDVNNPNYRRDARAFYEARCRQMHAGARLLWPEQEDLYTLMCMRAESGGRAFEREKQNSPLDPELCEWPEEYFGPDIWFSHWPGSLRVKVLALDPSKGADARRGDYSAYVMLGVDRQGVLYLEAHLARRNTLALVAEGVELYRQFAPDLFAVEANQFQELLGEMFQAEFRRQGLLGVRPVLVENHTNKQVRIRRLGPYLASGRMRFKSNSPGTRLLVDQMRTFPLGDHDDGPDAAEMALRLAAELLGGRGPAERFGGRLPVG